MESLEKISPVSSATGDAIHLVSERSRTVSRKSQFRLTIAEKAFARGLKALRDGNYPEAKRQLAGFLELTGNSRQSDSRRETHHQPHTLQGIRVVVEALELLLAISEEITILEPDGR